MLAPMQAADQEQTASQAMSSSLKSWRNHFWQMFTFIGLGCFFVLIPQGILLNLNYLLGKLSWWRVVTDDLYIIVVILLQAVVTLVMWEFYTRVISGTEIDTSRVSG